LLELLTGKKPVDDECNLHLLVTILSYFFTWLQYFTSISYFPSPTPLDFMAQYVLNHVR
jgi:hypothetical protein